MNKAFKILQEAHKSLSLAIPSNKARAKRATPKAREEAILALVEIQKKELNEIQSALRVLDQHKNFNDL